jgi:hypothetical protein
MEKKYSVAACIVSLLVMRQGFCENPFSAGKRLEVHRQSLTKREKGG